jgi:hypothetical protein
MPAPRPHSAAVLSPQRPSLLRYSPGLVAVAIAIADAVRRADPDLWGHLAFGRWVLSHHHLLTRDIYSYTAPGRIVHDHEWLTEIVLAAAYNALGNFGLKLVKLACVAATMVMVALSEEETGASELAQFAVLLLVGAICAPYFQFRPQTITFALFSAFILILSRDAYRRAGRLWVTILLLMVWANLHGGFIMGVAAIVTYAGVAGWQDFAAGRGWSRALRLGAIAAAATLATLINPYGIGIWETVAHALANPYTRVAVADWQPTFKLLTHALGAERRIAINLLIWIAMIAATAAAWMLSRDPADLPIVAIAAVVSAAAIVTQRNIPLAAIALAGPLLRHGRIAFLRWRGEPIVTPAPMPRGPAANQVLLAAIAIVLLFATQFFSGRLKAAEQYPAGAVAFMKQHDLHGNVLCEFGWGEYLIWHLAPESKVFIDGRYDTVYPMNVVLDFLRFHYDQPGGSGTLDRWPSDFVLIAPKSHAVQVMRSRADWKLIYRDDSTLLYAPTRSPAARIAGLPIKGANPPTMFP